MKSKSSEIKLLLFTILLATHFSYSQTIEWSDLQKMEGRSSNIYPLIGKDFYSLSFSGMLGNKIEMQYHDDFEVVSNEKVGLKVENSEAKFYDAKVINEKFYMFLTDHKDGVNSLYYLQYGTSSLPEGDPIELVSYTYPSSWKKSGSFTVIQSDNKEYFSVEYEVPHSDTENERFGYRVFDKNFKLISEGEYESPYAEKESSFTFHELSDYGDLFFGMKVFNVNENGKVKDRTSIKNYFIFLVRENGLKNIELNLGDKFVTDLSFTADQNRMLTCTGLYGSKTSGTGAFYFQVDFDHNLQVNEGFYEFTKEFITQDFSDRTKEKMDKKEAKGKGSPQLYDYDFRDVQTLSDGGIIAFIEQYYVMVTSSYDPNTGRTSTTYTYYYNDIISYRVDANGKFQWVNKIDKHQRSINDNGYCSSFAGYQKDNTYTLFFNDNVKNYDETGSFVGNPKNRGLAYASTTSTRQNAVAIVQLDMLTGEFTRKSFTTRKDTESIAIPKSFRVDYVNNEMFLYFRTLEKEKFGLLRF